ncbi:MAG: cytochrome c3 family protein [Acidobacteria bacterium]|nr:cytochrome c3 family protein [Acidobacteriota bacterium]MBI1984036.1 cytochrome c3 family protein [Acidobacteriota bacterium]
MKKVCAILLLLCPAAALTSGQQQPVYKAKKEKLPAAVAPQPIAFSHKKHASAEMGCLDCHVDALEDGRAGLPSVEECMACHQSIKTDSPEIMKLAAIRRRNEKVNWVAVYRVPDFVFFSHANHLQAGEECVTCHGPVAQREVLAKEISTNMTACMNCHAARKVSNECYLCHQLGH